MKISNLLIVLILGYIIIQVSGAKTGYFWQFTDTHWQRDYTPGATPGKAGHCRVDKGTGEHCGPFGDYNCDTPTPTLEAIFNRIVEDAEKEKPQFILWTGDHVSDYDGNASILDTQDVLMDITNRLRTLKKTVGVPVFPIIGNHDTYPSFQFPAKAPFFVYDFVRKNWGDFLSPQSLENARKNQYYSERVLPGLRIVAVNTAMFFCANALIPFNTQDPGDQNAWLRAELEDARNAGDKVFLIAHVPFGLDEETRIYQMWRVFHDQLVEAMDGFHGNTIAASFYGHNHINSFKIMRNSDGSGASVGFLTSSVSPKPLENPSITKFVFDLEAPFTIRERINYYIDIEESNKVGEIVWKKSYSTAENYGLADCSADSMMKFINNMRTDRALFDQFYSHLWANYQHRTCDKNCQKQMLCTLEFINMTEVNVCVL